MESIRLVKRGIFQLFEGYLMSPILTWKEDCMWFQEHPFSTAVHTIKLTTATKVQLLELSCL